MEILKGTFETQPPTDRLSPPPLDRRPKVDLDLEDHYCVLQVAPYDSVVALGLALKLRKRGRTEEAARILRSLLKIDSSFDVLYWLGQSEYDLDHLIAALDSLQKAALIAPEFGPEVFDLFKTLGNIFVRRGDLELAEDSFHKAHRLNPNSDVLQVNLGTLAMQMSNWTVAVDHYRAAVDLNSKNDKAWTGLALGHRACGDVELSWGNLEAALQHNCCNEVALGLALDWGVREGREFRVLELIRNFLVAGGWSERLSLAFVWLSWRRGDVQVARLELERILAVNPSQSHALELLHEMRAIN